MDVKMNTTFLQIAHGNNPLGTLFSTRSAVVSDIFVFCCKCDTPYVWSIIFSSCIGLIMALYFWYFSLNVLMRSLWCNVDIDDNLMTPLSHWKYHGCHGVISCQNYRLDHCICHGNHGYLVENSLGSLETPWYPW